MAKILASVPVFQQDRFTYNKDTGSFSAFASDFTGQRMLSRLYDDACDVGFGIQSRATGKIVYFAFEKNKKRDGELISEHFVAVVDGGSALAGLKVVVFNT